MINSNTNQGEDHMKPRTELSMQLYHMLVERGYHEELCDVITKNLNTDFTAARMIGYLCQYSHLPPHYQYCHHTWQPHRA